MKSHKETDLYFIGMRRSELEERASRLWYSVDPSAKDQQRPQDRGRLQRNAREAMLVQVREKIGASEKDSGAANGHSNALFREKQKCS